MAASTSPLKLLLPALSSSNAAVALTTTTMLPAAAAAATAAVATVGLGYGAPHRFQTNLYTKQPEGGEQRGGP